MVTGPSLTPELLAAAQRAESAATAAGLSFFEVVFEMLDASEVNAVAAYGGFPNRYPSWRFGMEYERLSKGHEWGLSKIYELVVNHDPTIAYLLRSNSALEQKLVMAHVFGHADFFRHNAWFAPTERAMMPRFGEHARRIQGYADRHGRDRVERFLDVALSLEPLLDPYGPQRRHRAERRRAEGGGGLMKASQPPQGGVNLRLVTGGKAALPGGGYLPTFDLLRFLGEHAELEDWERDVLGIVSAEAEYFLPQRMTKIINEGWASFWHSRLLTGGLLTAGELVDFADCHSSATQAAPGQLNPYKLGIELFRHAERRGLDLFRLRTVHNDVSFVDEVMDEEFIERSSLFVSERGSGREAARIQSRDHSRVKQELLRSMAWAGQPRIALESVGGGGRRELLLRHHHDGRDLHLEDAGAVLKAIGGLWGAPVQLLTFEGEQERLVTVEGGEVRVQDVGTPAAPLPSRAG